MDPFTVAIILIVIGAIFLIIEAMTPGAFMVIPGVILVILGLVGAVAPDLLYSWWVVAIAIVIAIPVTAITVKGYQKLAEPEPPTTMVSDSLVGKSGVVTVTTNPDNLKGKVKIGSDLWSASSDEIIEEGTRVIVESSEGVHVHVRRLESE